MSQPPDSTSVWTWIAGIAGITVVVGFLYAVGQKIFNYVTRTELAQIVTAHGEQLKAQDRKFLEAQSRMKSEFEDALDQHRNERREIAQEQNSKIDKMHGENREVNTAIFQQLREQDKAIARIEGALSGRHPTLGPNAR